MSHEQLKKLNETVEKERGRLFSFIRKRVPRTEDAEDILQDVMFQLVNTYHNAGSIEKVTAWLFRVARNRITDTYRKKKAIPMSERSIAGANAGGEDGDMLMLEDILPDFTSMPDELMAREIVWEALQNALSDMPEEQRYIFVQHEFEDRSFKDLSEETGVSVNTLLSRKRYAVLFLRDRLKELYNEI